MAQTGRSGTFGDWIYVRVTGGFCGEYESWYSPTKDASAIRSDNRIEFRDHSSASSAVEYSFDVREQVLYRVPENRPRRQTQFLELVKSFQQAFRSGRLPDDPKSLLACLGPMPDELIFSGHSLGKADDAQGLLEYRLTLQRRGTQDVGEYVFRLDEDAALLRTMQITGTWDDKAGTQLLEFEYPTSGPADIYALGVPRSAKPVDR